jgi:hypothetical protein
MEKGFYHPTIGYWQTLSDPSDEIISQYPKGTIEVSIIPGEGYQFNGNEWIAPSQEWLNNTAAEEARNIRDSKLSAEVDLIVTNPLRWNDLTPEKQQEWANYRRNLLDISNQEGWPHNINWPTKPNNT